MAGGLSQSYSVLKFLHPLIKKLCCTNKCKKKSIVNTPFEVFYIYLTLTILINVSYFKSL